MRLGSDHALEALAASVPLTGREPVLGKLKIRLRNLGPAGGWLGIAGPPGSGVSRLLAEAARQRQEAQPGPPPLHLAPAEAHSPRFEPLRRALLPWWRAGHDASLRAALQGVLPPVGGGADALLAWLGAGPLAAGALVPPTAVVRAALEALTAGGLVIADDWLELDAPTRRLLEEASRSGSAFVLAGVSHAGTQAPALPGPVWPLDPLAESQLELLLKRWLRNAVTARRLTPELMRRTEGWPGRSVALTVALAHAGVLEAAGRGWAVKQWPRSWSPFEHAWERRLARRPQGGPAALRVVEAGSLVSEPVDPAWLAETAGVKRALVDEVLATAAACRHGRASGRLFADEAERREVLQRIVPARRTQLAQRLVAVIRAALAERPSLEAVLACLEAQEQLPVRADLGAPLDDAVRALRPLRRATEPALALVERCAARLAQEPAGVPVGVLLGAAGLLGRNGQALRAAALLAVAEPAEPTLATPEGRGWLSLAARHGAGPARTRARTRLASLLAAAGPGPGLHEAWRALAESPDSSAVEARRAWRAALGSAAPCSLEQRAALHEGLGSAAEAGGRPRAACAHARRAAVLSEAQGDLARAAQLWADAGRRELALGRCAAAEPAFRAAARAWEALGELAPAADALVQQAQACLPLSLYDEAVPVLERALACVKAEGLPEREVAVQLRLAHVHRCRGDVSRERTHARAALDGAGTPNERLVAHGAWLRCELRLGAPGAVEELAQAVAALEGAGLEDEARSLRAALVDERLRGGDVHAVGEATAAEAAEPEARLSRARVLRLTGRPDEAAALLEQLGRDAALPVEVRAEAYARLAELQSAQAAREDAGRSAQAASALLEVPRRSHARDPRLHRMLARVFRTLGARARSVEHRAAARRTLRLPPPAEVAGRARRHLARSLWRDDPRPLARPLALALPG